MNLAILQQCINKTHSKLACAKLYGSVKGQGCHLYNYASQPYYSTANLHYMNIYCLDCSVQFEISEDDENIYKKMSPVIAGNTLNIDPPKLCPLCRLQTRFAYRNDWNYYQNTCHLCAKNIISIYSPDKKLPVLCDDCFWGDNWDPLSFGQKIDWNTSFVDQFFAMKAQVPRLAIFHTQSENSDFTVHSSGNKNCYMCSSTIICEDVYFCDMTFDCKNCMDLLSCLRLEQCYQCVFSEDSHTCQYLDHCFHCSACTMCFDCRGCSDCIGCTSLRQQKSMILNKPATNQEIEDTRRRLHTDPLFKQKFEEQYTELMTNAPRPYAWFFNTENCTGQDISGCKNCHIAFDTKEVEDAKHVHGASRGKDLYDVSRVRGEMIYYSHAIIDSTFCSFVNLCYQSSNLLYCDNCQACQDCFGCMSLKKAQYCIFNMQYSRQEYEELLPKLVEHMKKFGEWGEFFPIARSPFGYNESKAYTFKKLSREHVLQHEWHWSDYKAPEPSVSKTIEAHRLPNDITQIPDEVVDWAIICESTGRPFRIIKQELDFYRQYGLPLPHFCPQERHNQRGIGHRDQNLYERICCKCTKNIQTSYSPESEVKVYCEECYLQEVY